MAGLSMGGMHDRSRHHGQPRQVLLHRLVQRRHRRRVPSWPRQPGPRRRRRLPDAAPLDLKTIYNGAMADPAEFNKKVKVFFFSCGTEPPLENPDALKKHQETARSPPGSPTATSTSLPAPRTNGRPGDGACMPSLRFCSSNISDWAIRPRAGASPWLVQGGALLESTSFQLQDRDEEYQGDGRANCSCASLIRSDGLIPGRSSLRALEGSIVSTAFVAHEARVLVYYATVAFLLPLEALCQACPKS